jgi:hypothetical protein
MHPLMWIGVAVGGIAVWRRKHLKDDTAKVKTAAAGAKAAATEKIAAARGDSSDEATEVGASEADAAETPEDVAEADTEDESALEGNKNG